jgi:hypothetical protein
VRFGRAKEVVVVHDCSIIWPCPVSTPTSIEDLDLPNPGVVKNENEEIGKKRLSYDSTEGQKVFESSSSNKAFPYLFESSIPYVGPL